MANPKDDKWTMNKMLVWRTTIIVILGMTALFKFIAVLHPTSLLMQTDHLLKIPILYVVELACLAEVVLCFLVWLSPDQGKVAWCVFVFAVAIFIYRGMAAADGISYCPCLGNVADWWPWLGRHEGPILISIANFLFLTSAIQLMPQKT